MAINFFSKKKKEETQDQDNNLTTVENTEEKEQKTVKEEPKLTEEDIQEINRVLDINTAFIKSEEKTEVPTIIDIETKKKDVRKKKIRFKILFYTFIVSSMILILTPIGINFYKEHFIPPKPVIVDNEETIDSDTSPKIDPEQIVEYKNDDLRVSLEHLYKAPLFENIEQTEKTKKIDIIYDKYKPNQNIDVEELSEGYIFRVSTFFTNLRTLDEIAHVKKEAFASKCPAATTLTPTRNSLVNGIDGRSFDVLNCGADYKFTYVLKNGLNYEFSQIFKGDLGYRQAYKAETEDILNSIEFYPDEIPDLGPEILYDSKEYRLSFLYPKDLSIDCCFVNGPVSNNSLILLTVGDEDTYIDKNNMDAVGIYIDRSPGSADFNSYIEKQKKLLTDDYFVTMGEEPKSQAIIHTKVGDRDAIMLKGYSWRGNDLIYVDGSPGMDSSRIVVLSVKNISGDRFNNVVNRIMESFKFNVPIKQ